MRVSRRPSGEGLPPAALGFDFSTVSMVSRRTGGRVLKRGHFLGPEVDFELVLDAAAAQHGGHRDADVADAVGAIDQRGDGEDAFAVERDGVDDLGDRDADGEASAALELDDLSAEPRVRLKRSSPRLAVQPGYLSSGRPAAWAVDQRGTMLSPCSPRMVAVTWVAGRFRASAIRERKRLVSSRVPRPMTWLAGRPSCEAAR